MARFRWGRKEEKNPSRPTVSDDFIYDDPDGDATSGVASDTPEDALRKLREQPEPAPDSIQARRQAVLTQARQAEAQVRADQTTTPSMPTSK